MKRSGFKPKLPPRREATQCTYTPRPRDVVRMASGIASAMAAMRFPEEPPAPAKTPNRKQQAIRDSARGERCLMRLPGCPDNPEMTIWSHARAQRAGKGMGIKSLDLCGCYACTYCDAVYDGQHRTPEQRVAIELAWHEAHLESLVRLRQKGLA